MDKRLALFVSGGILSLVIAMGIGRFAYTPLLPIMQEDLAFSNAVAGYLATSNYAGYFIGAMLAGMITFRRPRTNYLRISILVSILTTASVGFFHSYIFLYVLRFASGVASAFVFVLASSIVLDKLAEKGKTSWSGLLYGGVGLGIFLSGLIISQLKFNFSWENIWLYLAVVSAILFAYIWIYLKDPSEDKKEQTQQNKHTLVPPPKWIPLLIIAYGLEGFGYIVTGTFIVSIAERTASFSETTVVWTIVGLVAIPSCIIWSALAKKWGNVKTLIFSMLLQCIGIILPVLLPTKLGLVGSAILFGATFMGITTIATTLARQMIPKNSSRIIGYLTAIYALGQMIGPSFAGILVEYTDNYNLALIGAASAVGLGACLLLTGIKYERKNLYAVCKY